MQGRKEIDRGSVSRDGAEPDLGFIFRKKFRKDPSRLSFSEINRIVFGDREPPTIKEHTDFVSCRGDVFDSIDLGNPDEVVDELLRVW